MYLYVYVLIERLLHICTYTCRCLRGRAGDPPAQVGPFRSGLADPGSVEIRGPTGDPRLSEHYLKILIHKSPIRSYMYIYMHYD